jgi:hypothetical protein
VPARNVQITRQEAGFTLDNLPGISEDQFNWLTYRMGEPDDDAANRKACVDPAVIDDWKEQPGFHHAYDLVTYNKREATKYLVTQINGKALRRMNDILDNGSARDQLAAATLAFKIQALLIERREGLAVSEIGQLMAMMRGTSMVEIPHEPARKGLKSS